MVEGTVLKHQDEDVLDLVEGQGGSPALIDSGCQFRRTGDELSARGCELS
jgi:hypothetical protein